MERPTRADWIRRNSVPLSDQEHGERIIRQARRAMNNRQLTTYQSPLLVPKEDAAELKKRLLYSLIGVNDFGNLRDQAAAATAQLALSFGLNPFNGEIWPIPQKRGQNVVGFSVYVGYKGLHRAARDVARNDLHTDFVFGKAQVLQPNEVEERGAHRCFRCGGKGTYGGGGKCFKCDGQGGFSSDDVIVVKIPVSLLSKVMACKEVSIEFEPTWGIGVWQPGDNIAEGRDPEWMATKRAKADALRQEFDLPFSYGESVQEPYDTPDIQIIDPADYEQHPVVDAAQLAGLTYDDEVVFIQVVEDAIDHLGFESPGHVMEAFVDLGQGHLSTDDLTITESALEHWLSQQAEPQQTELPIEEAA